MYTKNQKHKQNRPPSLKKRRKFIKLYSEFLSNTLYWLATQNGYSKLPLPLEKILQKFLTVLRTRGNDEAIKFCKNLRASLFKHLSKTPEGECFTGNTGELPKELRFLNRTKIKYDSTFYKLLLTVLYSSRILKTKAVPSFSTIEGEYSGKKFPFSRKDFKQFWITLGYNPRHRPRKKLEFRNFHRTTKAGPNGHALRYSFYDLLLIADNESLFNDICELGGKKLKLYMNVLLEYQNDLKNFLSHKYEGILRRLYAFSDKEGKTREIAIMDYYTQTCLRPLHLYLFNALKKIPQDYTFNQTEFNKTLTGTDMYYSIDLTAFTDRFPIEINYKLLRAKIGAKKASAWQRIMLIPFNWFDRLITYQVGNPMGAYSSWNSTTLSHHFVVWKACKNTGVDWKTAPYAMLGDDLVIRHKAVALEYCRLIRLIGVTWSKEKTHISPYFFEFAKRLHWCGHDVTPFPLAAMWEERDSSTIGAVSVYMNASDKGWFDPNDGIKPWAEYFRIRGYPRRLRRKWISSMSEIWKVISILQLKMSALELIPFVETLSPLVAQKLSNEEGEEKIFNILLNCIMMSLTDSVSDLQDTKKYPRPLGQYAEDLVIALTCVEQNQGEFDITLLPEALPHTHVWGVITEDYLRSLKRAYLIDTVYQGKWESNFRNILLPTSDSSVYIKREADTMLAQTPKIIKRFSEAIMQLKAYPQLI